MEFSISIDAPSKQFEQHLSVKDNNRILFSGPFGIGKTTFINNFFSNRSDQYLTITLRPINYAVASNEDIFKLIKYDILYQLLENEHVEVQDFGEFSELEIAKHYIHENWPQLLAPYIKYIPKIGAAAHIAYKGLNKLTKALKSFSQFKKDIKTNQEEKELVSFLAEINAEHYLLENDFITEIIKVAIKKINDKKSNTGGGVVLVIDDLDRIDPEHIFRLFNVFSTHFEYHKEADNKFGFHRVLFVCDLTNIRAIFNTKYGLNTDFNGYIDKFYSTEVFHYDNQGAVTEFIINTLSAAPPNSLISPRDLDFLADILSRMVEYKVLNLRSLIKTCLIHESDRRVNFRSRNKLNFDVFHFIKVAYALKYLMGSPEALIELLNKCAEISLGTKNKNIHLNKDNIHEYMEAYLVPVCTYNQHKGKQFDRTYGVKDPREGSNRPYIITRQSHYITATPSNDNRPHLPQEYIWHYLVDATQILKDNNII